MPRLKVKTLYQKYCNIPLQMKSAFWFTICNFLQKGILFLAVPIYTRILSTEQYGSYSVFLSWLEILEIIATFRIAWGGYVVGLTKYEDDKDTYASAMQSLSILITTVCFILYLLFANKINSLTEMNTPTTLAMFAILYAMPAIQFWTVRKRTEYKYLSVLFVTFLSSFFCVALGTLSALVCTQKDLAIIIARAITQGTIGIFLIITVYHQKFVIYQAEYWKRTIRFNVPLLPYYLSTVLLHSSDKIIIKELVGQAQAGIYGVAYTASMCMQLFSTSINQALQPWFFQKIKNKKLEGIHKNINAILILVAGLNLVLIALAPEVIMILAPTEYYEAIWVIPPLAASVVVMFFYQHFVNVEFYFEESRLTAMASIGAAILNITLNYLLIPVYGYIAAGYTTLISYLVFGIAHYFFMRWVCIKHDIPDSIFHIRMMTLILLVFFGIAAVLTIGYIISPIRYLSLAVLAIIVFLRRKQLMWMLGEIKR